MDTYHCEFYRDGEKFAFQCEADDVEHAVEQLLDAEPHAEDWVCEIYPSLWSEP